MHDLISGDGFQSGFMIVEIERCALPLNKHIDASSTHQHIAIDVN